MEHHTCRLLQGDNVIDSHAECWVSVFGSGGRPRSWQGSLQLSKECTVEPGESYELELDDGRHGTLVIKRIKASSGGEEHIEFIGSGALKKDQ